MNIFCLKLADLFSKVELEELLVRARYRVIEGFFRATEPNPRRLVMQKGQPRRRDHKSVRSSGNAIVDCADGKVGTLAHDILHRAGVQGRFIITEEKVIEVLEETLRWYGDSPRRYKKKPKGYQDAISLLRMFRGKHRDLVLENLNHELISLAICTLKSEHEIYFLSEDGIWLICQSTIDEHLENKRAARRSSASIKEDRRTYHGRPRGQTKRRGIPAGTSIGGLSPAM